MKLIVGLVNPGKKYQNTRHNTGFAVIDRTLAKLNVELDKNKFNADYTMINRNGEKIYILKPLTYMNLSGEAVAPFMKYFGIEPEDLTVVREATNEELEAEIVPMVDGGYKAIVFPLENEERV